MQHSSTALPSEASEARHRVMLQLDTRELALPSRPHPHRESLESLQSAPLAELALAHEFAYAQGSERAPENKNQFIATD